MRRHAILGLAGGLIILGAGWLFLAPTSVGGRVTYVTLSGTSMEPRLHSGDLVLTRRADFYSVGDVIAYRSPDLGRAVLHRVVEADGDRFVTKGDHNDWLDAYHPRPQDVIGRYWVRVPRVGSALRWLQVPRNAGLVAAVAVIAFLISVRLPYFRRHRRVAGFSPAGEQAGPNERRTPSAVAGGPGRLARVMGAVSVGSLVAAVTLAGWTYVHPATRTISSTIKYSQTGEFGYSALAPAGPVYESRQIATGDPVFLRLVSHIDLTFHYRLESDRAANVVGSERLAVRLSDGSGWHRTLVLQPETQFRGRTFTAKGRLDLSAIRSLIHRVQALTGMPRDTYTVTVLPVVTVAGTLAGEQLEGRFTPELTFRLDDLHLELEGSEAASGTPGDSLHPAEEQALTLTRTGPNPLAVFGIRLELNTVRLMATALAMIGLVAGMWIWWLSRRLRRLDEPDRINAQYGSWLLPVELEGTEPNRTVRVFSMENLLRVAALADQMVLHEEREGEHSYLVRYGGWVYSYHSGRRGHRGLGSTAAEWAASSASVGQPMAHGSDIHQKESGPRFEDLSASDGVDRAAPRTTTAEVGNGQGAAHDLPLTVPPESSAFSGSTDPWVTNGSATLEEDFTARLEELFARSGLGGTADAYGSGDRDPKGS
jgi:signal peptidase I